MLEAEMLKKVVLHSVATAFASIVFPVPGGPYSRTPFHGESNPCRNPLFHWWIFWYFCYSFWLSMPLLSEYGACRTDKASLWLQPSGQSRQGVASSLGSVFARIVLPVPEGPYSSTPFRRGSSPNPFRVEGAGCRVQGAGCRVEGCEPGTGEGT